MELTGHEPRLIALRHIFPFISFRTDRILPRLRRDFRSGGAALNSFELGGDVEDRSFSLQIQGIRAIRRVDRLRIANLARPLLYCLTPVR